jgi:hypothetical protein
MQQNAFIKIGQLWPEQGGIFAGLMRGENDQPDYYLILSPEKTDDLEWGKTGEKIEGADSKFDGLTNTTALIQHECPAAKWAISVETDGHKDFYLPAPRELSLLYANVPEHISEEWHWSSRHYSADGAWGQTFGAGNQSILSKNHELAVRAVRRVYPLSNSAI